MSNGINPDDYIPVIVNSLDGRSVTLSMEVIFESINALGKHPFLVVITSTGLVQARNKGFETLKKTFNTDIMTGVMLDSDVMIFPESDQGKRRRYYLRVLDGDKEYTPRVRSIGKIEEVA